MFSSQLNQVFFHVSGTTRMSPERTASIAGLARVAASTYHWSVSQGSITTPGAVAERRGDDAVLDLFEAALGFDQLDHALARLEPVEAEQLVGDQAVGGLDHLAPRHRAC